MSNNETTSCSQAPLPQLASSKSESTASVENSNEQENFSPPVPIKTYEWEELRRAKEKGGYPWTYLRESQYDKLRDSDEKLNTVMEAPHHDEGASLSEILTPVDHSKSTDDVSRTPSALSLDPSNAVIIIPIDHTVIEATEDHIYEPIQRQTGVEIHLNDLPIQIVTSSIIEPIDETKKDKNEPSNEPSVAGCSMATDDNEVTSGDKVPEMVVKRPPLLSRKLESQSMSVDEERTYLDKHIVKSTSLDEDYNKWSKLNDHEYEPISAPSQVLGETIPSSSDKASIAHIDEVDVDDDVSSTTSAERRYLRIPLDDELVVPDDGNTEDEAMKSENISMDERYLNATPTTTISRTDCELNTSQVDSSALEDLPLHRGSRKKATLAVAENTKGQNFQERMRSSAGKLKSKLKGIRKPKERKTPEVKPERAKSEKKSFFERSKFSMPKMPERRKLSMPKMPERPKITMPKMPDRPKISMPKMPERPKINMPKMPDISMPKMPEISMPKMPEINFSSLSRNKPSTTRTEEVTIESTTTDDSGNQKKRNKFEFDFRTYPKILHRTKKAKTVVHEIPKTGTKSQKSTFFALAPDWVTMPRKNRKKPTLGKSLPKKIDSPTKQSLHRQGSMQTNYDKNETPDVQIIRLRDYSLDEDQNMSENEQEALPYDHEVEEILKNSALDQTTAFEEINLKSDITPQIYHQDREEIRNSLKAISGESLPRDQLSLHEVDRGYASSERGGVIEEINADEFFVREKGISQDNIDVSRYLSSEIREAFQTPVNVLSQMAEVDRPGYYYYDHHFDDYYRENVDSPVPPQTPPPRTLRKKKGKTPSSTEENIMIQKEQEKVEENNLINKEKDLENEQIIENIITYDQESYKTFPPKRPSRSRSKSSLTSKKTLPEDVEEAYEEPVAPFRRKRSLTSSKSLNASDYALQKLSQNVSLQEIRYHEYQQPGDIKPVAPKRKLRPSQSHSTVHTINDDDRTSHGADSIVSEDRIVTELQSKEPPEIPGYAKVDKSHSHPPISTAPPPPRTRKKKKSKDTQFFTVPRRLRDGPPERPKRTYSTLQTRKSRERSIPIVSAPDKENYIQDTQYIEIDDDDGIARNLQSGEVIEKMKTRPLPAPPRPPRKTRESVLRELPIQDNRMLSAEDKNDGLKSSNESIVKGMLFLGNQVNIVTEITPSVHMDDETIDSEDTFRTIIQQSSFSDEEVVVEVEMSTQTDPLPDDFCCEEVVTEPTDIILAPTRRRRISQDINQIPVVVAEIPREEFYHDFSSETHPDVQPEDSISLQGRRGILEQQSQERYSESPIGHEDEIMDSFVRLTRSQQSTLISRPVAEETTQSIPSEPIAVALPETLRVERLQVSDLDVDRLTVSDLLAQKIMVSEIDGMSLKINDVTSTSGSLTTEEIKLPPGFIESIIEKIQAARLDESEASSEPKTVIEKHVTYVKESSTNTDEPMPSTSQEGENIAVSVPNVTLPASSSYPYPHIFVLPSTFQMPEVAPSTSTAGGATPTCSPSPAPDAVEDPSIPDLSVQLLRACHSSIKRTVRQVIMEVSSQLNSGDEKRDARTAVVLIVILIAGLILLGMISRGDTIHHHHWEYFNPPNGDRPV